MRKLKVGLDSETVVLVQFEEGVGSGRIGIDICVLRLEFRRPDTQMNVLVVKEKSCAVGTADVIGGEFDCDAGQQRVSPRDKRSFHRAGFRGKPRRLLENRLESMQGVCRVGRY